MSRLGNELSLQSRPLFRLSELLIKFDFNQSVGHSFREIDTVHVVIFIHHSRGGLYRIHIRFTFRYIGLISFLLFNCKFFNGHAGLQHELYRDIIHKAYIIQ